jgi:hypothetical protein
MTSSDSRSGGWRITVKGAVTPVTASLLDDFRVSRVESTTALETDRARPDDCASTIARLQSCGLQVLEIHWLDLGPCDE